MDTHLVIESEEAFDLANRLAKLTGRDVASVVTEALRARVAAENVRQQGISSAAEAKHREECGPPVLTIEDLYDEHTGLPV